MPDTTETQARDDLIARIGVAVISKMEPFPALSDDMSADHRARSESAWHDAFADRLRRVCETAMVTVPQSLTAAASFEAELAKFDDPEEESTKRVLYAEIVDFMPGPHRGVVVASLGFGSKRPTLQQAQRAYKEAGGRKADHEHFGRQGYLNNEFGLKLFRTPFLRSIDGRGKDVAATAKANIGRAVMIYKVNDSFKAQDGDTRQLRVAWHIRPLDQPDVSVEDLNASIAYDPREDDDDNTTDRRPAEGPAPARRGSGQRQAGGGGTRGGGRSGSNGSARRQQPAREDGEPPARGQSQKRRAAEESRAPSEEDELDALFPEGSKTSRPARRAFKTLSELVECAKKELGMAQVDVMTAFQDIGYARENAKDAKALAHTWEEISAA